MDENMFRSLIFSSLAGLALTTTACAQTGGMATGGDLNDIYLHLHQNPELSFKEKNSSALMAAEAEALGFKVTKGLGDEWTRARAMAESGEIIDGVGGYGVVAVMENGPGPVVMVRADMDALPVPEQTGKSYASTKTDRSWDMVDSPVMHACGHDVHMTVWIGVAREMAAKKDQWSGTLVMIAQPAEELGLGAKAMLEDGLFENFPYPDYNLALHVDSASPAGEIGYVPGYAMANVDSVDIHVHGVGGHGAYPHGSKDPIVASAYIVAALQTLISRETSPLESGVVTVGMISGGYKHNIIPAETVLKLTVRSYKDDVRENLLSGVKRIAEAQAASMGLPKAPDVIVKEDYTPAVYNDPALVARTVAAMEHVLGEGNLVEGEPVMGGEDFARYGRTEPRIPSFMFKLGSIDPGVYAEAMESGTRLPTLHSPFYAPDYDLTIKTGVTAMTAAAMDLLSKPE